MLDRVYGEPMLRVFAGWADQPLWLGLWMAVSFLGSPLFFTTAVPLLYAFTTRARASRLAAAFLASSVVSEIVKAAIARPRLDPARFGLAAPLEHGGEFESFSLPSGHVLTAAVVWGVLALRARSPLARAACWAVLPLMAVSRMALLRHDLLDVAVGLALGAVVLAAFVACERGLVPRLAGLPWVEQAGLATLAAIAVAVAWPVRTAALGVGVLAGLLAGSAWAQASLPPPGGFAGWRAAVAGVLGLGGAVLARWAGAAFFAGTTPYELAGVLAVYWIAGVWIAAVVPAWLGRRRGGDPAEAPALGDAARL